MATENVRAALKQTRLCKYWSSNRCMMGESCNFAHSHQELRATPDLVATKLCFQWSSKGRCKKGSACTFAHGKHQLRQPDEKKPNPTSISWEPMKVMLEIPSGLSLLSTGPISAGVFRLGLELEKAESVASTNLPSPRTWEDSEPSSPKSMIFCL
ncbi:unnamed protein product [Effrenium voratum]|nr:unnamed protein product [Effrenium voratum]|eukprot:CAMPEP_0181447692 /NCGR_PEP_ID=MMETSP1110-20121109/26752_1 /TAXON_ID=174948 /ORGANISM="Symbiodinium sp., Strain CCMP421" /LENGTH=154 /DNA_ID=CAMNT_0023571811 /DNA_START=61 /DNA_END=525 /DNA_ORIENTATION=+